MNDPWTYVPISSGGGGNTISPTSSGVRITTVREPTESPVSLQETPINKLTKSKKMELRNIKHPLELF